MVGLKSITKICDCHSLFTNYVGDFEPICFIPNSVLTAILACSCPVVQHSQQPFIAEVSQMA